MVRAMPVKIYRYVIIQEYHHGKDVIIAGEAGQEDVIRLIEDDLICGMLTHKFV